MFVLSMKVGEAITIGRDMHGVAVAPNIGYGHRYQCWLCKCTSVLEFEPEVSQPSWTECPHCGLNNEINAGLYHCPAIIPGQVPSRII
jgi:hypothetical protein